MEKRHLASGARGGIGEEEIIRPAPLPAHRLRPPALQVRAIFIPTPRSPKPPAPAVPDPLSPERVGPSPWPAEPEKTVTEGETQ